MHATRATGGLLVAAIGAAAVALATYQPWYAVGITSARGTGAEQQIASVAHQYGSPALLSMANRVGPHISQVAGRPAVTLSAHQSLHWVGTVILVLAALAALVSLLRLAGMLQGNGGVIAFLGVIAAGCTVFRLHQPPNPAPGYLSLSLSWGGWVALVGAVAVVVGGLRSPYSRL
jgi:hypothetical protein